ncbi:carboxymethylenebutenolidase homolog isoform X1 [Anolis carolinensis]|uniref:carboxymethylenebutenolidase homolog isoform X1 n=1 Tax=Anolis carolinensis TaxID=28377 RepID=UPI002F2B54D7
MTSKDLPFQYDIGRRSNYVGRGKEIHFDNINAYVCQPDYDTNNAVILVHDIYGWQFPDTRYITDIFASNGYITICPDFFLGKEPWKPNNHWHDFADWLKERDPMKVDKTTAVFMKCLKEKYKAMKIGVVGFSWGGMAVHHLMLKNPELKAGISDYGIIRDSEDRYNLLNPTFFIFGGNDHTISPEQVTLLERKLKDYCTVDYKIKVYPGQVHGFAQCKPEDMKPKDVPFMEEARMDMIDWLNRYIMF